MDAITEHENQMVISFLKEQPYAHVQNKEYLKARKMLDDVSTQHRLRDLQELEVLLSMTECDLHMSRKDAGKCVERLHDKVLDCKSLKAVDVEVWGDEMKKNDRNVGSILLYWISSDKYKTEATDPNDLVKFLRERALDVENLAAILRSDCSSSYAVVVSYVIEFVTEIFNNIRATTGANPDTKALLEGECLNAIVCVCNNAREYQKAIRFGSMGTESLEQQFGVNASKYQIYGILLHNLGDAYHNSRHYEQAEPFYMKSADSKKNATDFISNESKEESIEETEAKLADTRRRLHRSR